MQRTRVDLPEPESPITTKISPASTSSDTSRTPTIQAVCLQGLRLDLRAVAAQQRIGVSAEDLPHAGALEDGWVDAQFDRVVPHEPSRRRWIQGLVPFPPGAGERDERSMFDAEPGDEAAKPPARRAPPRRDTAA